MRLLLACLLPSLAFGQAQVQYLPKGTPAPYDGFLFSKEAESKNRKLLLELDENKKLNEINNQIIANLKTEVSLLDQQKNLWKLESENLSRQLINEQEKTFWNRVLFFGLGVLTTTAIVYGVNQASK